MKKFSDKEIAFIVEYPEYPVWLIVEAFKEKFGRSVSRSYVHRKRVAARGTSNANYGRSGISQAESKARWTTDGARWKEKERKNPYGTGYLEE